MATITVICNKIDSNFIIFKNIISLYMCSKIMSLFYCSYAP